MGDVDLNLLSALDALLAESSVIGAARKMNLSPSAMSRTLERLRRATGDPLLVRAGRGLVPTPHAIALREQVHTLARDAKAVLQSSRVRLDPAAFDLGFTIRANEWFMEMLSSAVVAKIARSAPRVRLRFAPKHQADPDLLRDGSIDLEIGKREISMPEIRTQLLFRDRYVGIVRKGHPLLAAGRITPKSFTAYGHVASTLIGQSSASMDAALNRLHLTRTVQVIVPSFSDAIRVAASSDLIALAPRSSLVSSLARDRSARPGVAPFEIPVRLQEILVSAMWHPRMDAEPSHRWLRQVVISVCKEAYAAYENQTRIMKR